MGTVNNLSAVSHLRCCVYVSAAKQKKKMMLESCQEKRAIVIVTDREPQNGEVMT